MKFSGLHFHMVLVVGLICVIVYVFYISKDILTLDTEVRQLKQHVDVLNRRVGSGGQGQMPIGAIGASRQMPPVVAPSAGVVPEVAHVATQRETFQVPTQQHVVREVVADVVTASESDDEDDDNDSDIDNERIRRILNSMQEDAEEDEEEVPVSHVSEGQVPVVSDSDAEQVATATVETSQPVNEEAPKTYSVIELRAMCKERGVSQKGTKDQLRERLGLVSA
jgi:hypothetical protein